LHVELRIDFSQQGFYRIDPIPFVCDDALEKTDKLLPNAQKALFS